MMAAERRPYRREAEDKRRGALIAATLALVSEGGAASATVRAIAERAGVTPGLIRHYFASKEQLIATAYRQLMVGMTEDSAAVLTYAPTDPHARLAAFVAASLRPPVVDREAVTRWAFFIQETRRSVEMLEIHHQTYLGFRDHLQSLIAALPEPRPEAELRRLAIACNALIDGLWLEGGTLPDAFAKDELVHIGISGVGAMLGVDLHYYLLLTEPPQS
jgi:TetR/AcrR family transcriptional repressor of bet genes